MRKLISCVGRNVFKNVYHDLFHCNLLYGIHLWGHSANTIKIFRLQKSPLRILAQKPNTEHNKNLFIEYQMLTFPSYMSMLVHNFIKILYIHSYSIRNCNNYNVNFCRTSKA